MCNSALVGQKKLACAHQRENGGQQWIDRVKETFTLFCSFFFFCKHLSWEGRELFWVDVLRSLFWWLCETQTRWRVMITLLCKCRVNGKCVQETMMNLLLEKRKRVKRPDVHIIKNSRDIQTFVFYENLLTYLSLCFSLPLKSFRVLMYDIWDRMKCF